MCFECLFCVGCCVKCLGIWFFLVFIVVFGGGDVEIVFESWVFLMWKVRVSFLKVWGLKGILEVGIKC